MARNYNGSKCCMHFCVIFKIWTQAVRIILVQRKQPFASNCAGGVTHVTCLGFVPVNLRTYVPIDTYQNLIRTLDKSLAF